MERRVVVLRAAFDRSTARSRSDVARILELRRTNVIRLERRALRHLRAGCDGGGTATAGTVTVTATGTTTGTTAPSGVATAAVSAPAGSLLADTGTGTSSASAEDRTTSGDGRGADGSGSDTGGKGLDSLRGEVDIPGTESGERVFGVPAAAGEAGPPSGLLAVLFGALVLTGALVFAIGVRRDRDRLVLAHGGALRHPLLLGFLKVTGVVLAGLLAGAAIGLIAGSLLG